MRRPLPPELVRLGDQLEEAAGRAISSRRERRQLVLNAVTTLVVAVPLALAFGSTQQRPGGVTQLPAPVRGPMPAAIAAEEEPARPVADDYLPRDLSRQMPPGAQLLVLPPSLRPALR